MTHRAPAEGTANTRQHYKDPDGRENVVHYPDLSAKHADEALAALLQSRRTDLDSRDRDRQAVESQVLATLSLRDKLDELTATVTALAHQVLDSQERLNENVKTAAEHLHRDALELEKHLTLVRGEAA